MTTASVYRPAVAAPGSVAALYGPLGGDMTILGEPRKRQTKTSQTTHVGQQGKILAHLAKMPKTQLLALEARLRWRALARPEQYWAPRDDWFIWLMKPGRGWGKTRTGAEYVFWEGWKHPLWRIAVIGATNDDTRKISFEGESGLLNVIPPKLIKKWNRSSMELRLVNGTMFFGYSSEKPDRLRGPQHHLAWGEELASWQRGQELYDMVLFGLRLGTDPRFVITTTPRPIKLIKDLVKDPMCAVTDGSTFDNRANLAATTLNVLERRYAGTRLGRQELGGEIMDDNPNALWKHSDFEWDGFRLWDRDRAVAACSRIVVAVDPAVTATVDSDETGIVSVGLLSRFRDGNDGAVVLADDSGTYHATEWPRRAVARYHELKADCIVAEINNGGDLVTAAIHAVDDTVPVRVVHASRGKTKRAEPVAMLYQQRRVLHAGVYPALEDQCANYDPLLPAEQQSSPDRMDGLVWGVTELLLESGSRPPAPPTSLPNIPAVSPYGY